MSPEGNWMGSVTISSIRVELEPSRSLSRTGEIFSVGICLFRTYERSMKQWEEPESTRASKWSMSLWKVEVKPGDTTSSERLSVRSLEVRGMRKE